MSFSPNTGLPNSNTDGATATQPAVRTLDMQLLPESANLVLRLSQDQLL